MVVGIRHKKMLSKPGNAGFTLVEVVVISVIVSVLALSAIMLYAGYVQDVRLKVANHTATTAANYLNTAENMDVDIDTLDNQLVENDQWVFVLSSGGEVVYKCPHDVTIIVDNEAKTVKAIVKNIESTEHKYSQ